MRILILGGDGYLGWPTAMHLAEGHDVTIVDNYYKRELMKAMEIKPLFDVPDLPKRCDLYEAITGKRIRHITSDITKPTILHGVIKAVKPDCIIHYAEQPSAPYSMMGEEQAIDTSLNITGTIRLIHAVKLINPEIHVIKLGTMGEYGTPNTPIPEGWFECEYKGHKDRMLFPKRPQSLYHVTKVCDSEFLAFACRVWGLKVTDLNQGVVYGVRTPQMVSPSLYTRFTYDGVFGTVLNRFLVQAIAGIPLTIYGKGGQTRGFLNIIDTLNCVELAALNPAKEGEFRVFNQFTEQFSVAKLANLVKGAGKSLGLKVEINHIMNPRNEAEEHFYEAEHQKLQDLGLEPNLLTTECLVYMLEHVQKYKGNINESQIMPKVKWEC